MIASIGFLGFGEVAQALAEGWRSQDYDLDLAAFDVLDRSAACRAHGVSCLASPAAVRDVSQYIISAVTADQQINVASSVAGLSADQLYLDMNSVSPGKKIAAAELLDGKYLDVAILSPILPARHVVPVMFAGDLNDADSIVLKQLFPASETVSATVGDAALFKMIRSVFVKGLEAVATECGLAAHRAGLADRLFPSLEVALQHDTVEQLVSYTMERVAVHGVRRAAEMEEVCATLSELGLPNHMSLGALATHRLVGEMELGSAPLDSERISGSILHRLDRNKRV